MIIKVVCFITLFGVRGPRMPQRVEFYLTQAQVTELRELLGPEEFKRNACGHISELVESEREL